MKFGKPQECNEVKILFVGHGKAGKTTLVNAIRGKEQPLTDPQDRTICINHEKIEIDGWLTRIFDFGGQEFYIIAQMPMITRSSLNLLCVNSDEINPEHYLWYLNQQLQSRAPGSPVQVILTKCNLVDDEEVKAQEVMSNIQNCLKKILTPTASNSKQASPMMEKLSSSEPKVEPLFAPPKVEPLQILFAPPLRTTQQMQRKPSSLPC